MDSLDLIKSGLHEIIGEQKLVEKLSLCNNLNAYWGTAPTGQLHIGYLIPLLKIRDLTKADINVKILIADLHSVMDANKTPYDKLESRTRYYNLVIKKLLEILNVDMCKIQFVQGSTHQTRSDYIIDMFKLSSVSSIRNCTKAGSDVVKSEKDPKISSIMYPILQALDEVYLNVDIQLGGVDQRKIFTYACDFLPMIGYNHAIYLMNPILGAINCKKGSAKMSSSDVNTKINFLDTEKDITRKINKAFCDVNAFNESPLYDILTMIIFKINEIFVINRDEKYGGIVKFLNIDEIDSSLKNSSLSICDLKKGVADFFIEMSSIVKQLFENEQELLKTAYDI